MSAAEATARAAIAAGQPVAADVVAELLRALAEARALADERWQAIGKLAPAAKARRDQARTLGVLAAEAATALDATAPELAAQLRAAAAAALG